MREVKSTVGGVEQALADAAERVFNGDVLRRASDDDVVALLTSAAAVVRRAEALVVAATGEVAARSAGAMTRSERLVSRLGCASVNELVRRSSRVTRRTAAAYERVAKATNTDLSPTTGEVLPANLPSLREVLRDGEAGVDGIDAVARTLADIDVRVGSEARLAADEHLAAVARGESPSGEPSACAETLRTEAQGLSLSFDPDGAEPRDRVALRRRALTLTPSADGLVRMHGHLMPETAGQLQRLFDSILNPAARPEFRPTNAHGEVAASSSAAQSSEATPGERWSENEAAPHDDRSPAQRRHDAFATAIDAAARSGGFPLIGGAAPTLVVSVRERDLASNRGYAHAEGGEQSVSLSAARHVACVGAVQRVVREDRGRIVRLETRDRVFNAHQRRAILLRDGGCIIPGCRVPRSWCEIHHVTEHAEGGATHTDNGVAICFHHHRTLDINGWHVRMREGIPEVLAPEWWDPRRRWRAVTKSPTSSAPDVSEARSRRHSPWPTRAHPPHHRAPQRSV